MAKMRLAVAKVKSGLYNQIMPTLNLNGRRVHYVSAGEGPPIILLHNATGSILDWRFLMPTLTRAGYRVIAYDRPGFGRSEPVAEWPLDYLHQDRDDLLALMDALELPRAALVGNSDGATISLLTAAAIPDRIVAVVAESPHLWYEKKTLLSGFQYFSETLEQDIRFQKAMTQAHGEQAQQVIARWQKRWLDPQFYSWDDSAVLEDITASVLIIHGEEDPFFPVEHSQCVAEKVAKAELVVLQGVGHVPHAEIANAYAKLTLDFLSTTYPAHSTPATKQ